MKDEETAQLAFEKAKAAAEKLKEELIAKKISLEGEERTRRMLPKIMATTMMSPTRMVRVMEATPILTTRPSRTTTMSGAMAATTTPPARMKRVRATPIHILGPNEHVRPLR